MGQGWGGRGGGDNGGLWGGWDGGPVEGMRWKKYEHVGELGGGRGSKSLWEI